MIIPIRCFTCGKVIADKYFMYLDMLEAKKAAGETDAAGAADAASEAGATRKYFQGTRSGDIMTKLGLTRCCCRRHMLGNVEMIPNMP
jgi:DNA-directed RNA polymerase I, II, and III subunit RPABC5